MSAQCAFEETPPLSNDFVLSGVPEFLYEVAYLKELVEGEITTQSLFMIQKTLQRLGVQFKALRTEVTSTT